MLNLVMAVFWLVVGGLLLGWQWLHPENRRLTIFGTGISIGWLALLLALYDLVRWRQERRLTRRQTPPAAVPDPNFNFTDQPPAED
jgi:hypothetical protein